MRFTCFAVARLSFPQFSVLIYFEDKKKYVRILLKVTKRVFLLVSFESNTRGKHRLIAHFLREIYMSNGCALMSIKIGVDRIN